MQLDYMEINSSPQQTEIEELRETNRKLKMEISSLKSKPVSHLAPDVCFVFFLDHVCNAVEYNSA